jgi:PAP2 superfamily
MADSASPFWSIVTRFGEAQILLPLALGLALLMWQRGASKRLALGWLGWIAVVAGITTASKLAFIGWGVGSADLDFTGISGHAMFAGAIYPVLMRLLPGGSSQRATLWRSLGVTGGVMLAALVAISRVMVHAHSLSEVLAGLALGLAASALTLRLATPSRVVATPMPRWMPALVAAWLVVLPHSAPASVTHWLVTQLALTLSGRSVPYQRSDLLRRTEPPGRPALPPRFDAATADPRSLLPRSDRSADLRGVSHRS